jgi:hypothetical protein
MKTKILAVVATAAMTLALSGGAAVAGKGGCPNPKSANGAAHANENSAHGPAKQAQRNCAPGGHDNSEG